MPTSLRMAGWWLAAASTAIRTTRRQVIVKPLTLHFQQMRSLADLTGLRCATCMSFHRISMASACLPAIHLPGSLSGMPSAIPSRRKVQFMEHTCGWTTMREIFGMVVVEVGASWAKIPLALNSSWKAASIRKPMSATGTCPHPCGTSSLSARRISATQGSFTQVVSVLVVHTSCLCPRHITSCQSSLHTSSSTRRRNSSTYGSRRIGTSSTCPCRLSTCGMTALLTGSASMATTHLTSPGTF
mmetsp:Transcript_51030/g.94365  ORF Transcript_51030/g.94365 Transcript_51030/m.94365 type:complete len:243 (+) Transcript_51030:836-1564(+)